MMMEVSSSSPVIRKFLELDCEKGASCWLSALPFQSLGYVLNKRKSSETVSAFGMDGLSPMFLDYVLAASKMTYIISSCI